MRQNFRLRRAENTKRLLNLTILVKSAPKAPKKIGVFPGGQMCSRGGRPILECSRGGLFPGGVKTTFMPLIHSLQYGHRDFRAAGRFEFLPEKNIPGIYQL